MISFVRVDNRLIHGQVVEAWLPHLKVKRIIVADDEAASSALVRAAMGLAVPSGIEVRIDARDTINYPALVQDDVKTLFLFRDLNDVLKAKALGFALSQLNLGNVHFSPGRTRVSASVFLSAEELEQIKTLVASGVRVEARGVPSDSPVELDEMVSRFEKGK